MTCPPQMMWLAYAVGVLLFVATSLTVVMLGVIVVGEIRDLRKKSHQ